MDTTRRVGLGLLFHQEEFTHLVLFLFPADPVFSPPAAPCVHSAYTSQVLLEGWFPARLGSWPSAQLPVREEGAEGHRLLGLGSWPASLLEA